MAASKVGPSLTLWISARGGSPTGGEQALTERVRDRLAKRSIPHDATQSQLEKMFLYGLAAIWTWLERALPANTLSSWSDVERGEHV